MPNLNKLKGIYLYSEDLGTVEKICMLHYTYNLEKKQAKYLEFVVECEVIVYNW